MVLEQNRHMGQWSIIESPKINSCPYGQLIFNKGDNNIQWEKVSSASGVGKVVQHSKIRTYPLIIHKNKLKTAYSLKHNMQHHKTHRREHRQKLYQCFLRSDLPRQ